MLKIPDTQPIYKMEWEFANRLKMLMKMVILLLCAGMFNVSESDDLTETWIWNKQSKGGENTYSIAVSERKLVYFKKI